MRPRILRLGVVRVSGRSMTPTLRDGDLLLIAYAARPRLGSLVLARLPPQPDGTPRPVAVKRLTGRDPADPARWWLERDNPREGVDSWLVGSVGADAVLGRVVTRIWPRPGRPRTALPR
ncbi:MAG: S24 family peptidase [Tetrasphaera sp.]